MTNQDTPLPVADYDPQGVIPMTCPATSKGMAYTPRRSAAHDDNIIFNEQWRVQPTIG
ncbi:MAG: hypothetical protein KZQ76_11220 [Candidatus Thiodiazotropha sp. (ex Epidulcina cf. delphinae)]|nr:hypothetical protein [Candidatus Thiodiazotropha sp. (ex Epidulcina cf. delphinae)]